MNEDNRRRRPHHDGMDSGDYAATPDQVRNRARRNRNRPESDRNRVEHVYAESAHRQGNRGNDALHDARRSEGGRMREDRRAQSARGQKYSAAVAASASESRRRADRGNEREASSYSASNYSARKKGMSRGKKIALGIVITLLVLLAAAATAFGLWYFRIADNIRGDGSITNLVAPAADEPYYVLLMGSDSREGFETITEDNKGDRADSIMIARVDEKNKAVNIISVPRDLRVKVEGHGYCKINSVVEYGGYNQLISTLNSILGIQINYYAKVYFTNFLELVDQVGGVTVEVPEGTATYGGDTILPAGDAVRLNGEQALILARCRHGWPEDQGAYAMGDYQRTLNQRNLIKAIAKEVLAQDVTALPGLIESLSQCVETNMSVDKLVSLAVNMQGMDVDSMQSCQLPIGASTINGDWQAVLYQDVFAVLDLNFINGDELFLHLDNFNPEYNDDNVGTDYTDGPIYAYTSYAQLHGSPFTDGYTPPASANVASKSTSSSSKSSSSSN